MADKSISQVQEQLQHPGGPLCCGLNLTGKRPIWIKIPKRVTKIVVFVDSPNLEGQDQLAIDLRVRSDQSKW